MVIFTQHMPCAVFVMCVYICFLMFPLRLSAVVSSVWEGFASECFLSKRLAENEISSQQKLQRGQASLLGHL